ncbi:hypothetical protein ABPG77_007279 [Micractinium sp. CCAP 211/92]
MLRQTTMRILAYDTCTRLLGPTNFSKPWNTEICADGFTSVAALRPWIDKTSQQLLAGRWTGDVWGDRLVRGFDGSLSNYRGEVGEQLDILTAITDPKKFSLTGNLIKEPSKHTTVLGSVDFKWFANVAAAVRNGKIVVTLNGKPLAPGASKDIPWGSVAFSPEQPRAARLLTIRQPNMVVRISQRYGPVPKRHLPFLDVSVTLKKLFPYPLGGVLGDTFVTGDVGA